MNYGDILPVRARRPRKEATMSETSTLVPPVSLCPSCGVEIARDSARCPFCRSKLGRCGKCETWVVVGTECLNCGPAEVVTTGPEPAAEEPGFSVHADPRELLAPLYLRACLALALGAALAMALACAGFGPAAGLVRALGLEPAVEPEIFWGTALLLGLLIGTVGHSVRMYRLRHTTLFGSTLQYRPRAAAWLWNPVVNVVGALGTAGLAVPWLCARNRRVFYGEFAVPARNGKPLGFRGETRGLLKTALLTCLCAPLVVATAGWLRALPAWWWLRWEQSNLLVPDRYGRPARARFTGRFWPYFGRATLGWFLTLLTLGVYRPWAMTAEWRWAAAHTKVE
jgi:hypothetical protein